MKETPRLIVMLTLIATVAGLLVGLAEAVTREPIARAKQKAFVDALREVLPPGISDPVTELIPQADGSTNTVYRAGDAVALETSSSKGYAGDIVLLVGFSGDGKLYNYKVLDHKETPGLGANITGKFRSSVTNRPAATTVWKVKKDGGDIDAITAATISSRAVCDAIAKAVAKRESLRVE